MTCQTCQFAQDGHTGPDCPMRRIGVRSTFSAGCNLHRMATRIPESPTRRQKPEPDSSLVPSGDRGRAVRGGRAAVRITLVGQIKGGKNNMVVTRTGLHFPKPEWAKWRDGMLRQVGGQYAHPPIRTTCLARVNYWAGDRKRRDVPAILDSIWHVLERSGVVEDDSLIKSVIFCGSYDKENPRAVIELEEMET